MMQAGAKKSEQDKTEMEDSHGDHNRLKKFVFTVGCPPLGEYTYMKSGDIDMKKLVRHHDWDSEGLQHTATQCNTRQHTATHCNSEGLIARALSRREMKIDLYKYIWPIPRQSC